MPPKQTIEKLKKTLLDRGFTTTEEKFINDVTDMNFIHIKCGLEIKTSWSTLCKRKVGKRCEKCDNFTSKKKSIDLVKLLNNIKENEDEYKITCLNKQDIKNVIFPAKWECNKCKKIWETQYCKSSTRGCKYCTSTKISEPTCRAIVEKLYGCEFPSCRPDFLKTTTGKNLELDCYNPKLKLGVEYNGIQHYKYEKHLHSGDENNLKLQQERDKLKLLRCTENNIHLVTISCFEMKEGLLFVKQLIYDRTIDHVKKLMPDIKVDQEYLKSEEIDIVRAPVNLNLLMSVLNQAKAEGFKTLKYCKSTDLARLSDIVLICPNSHIFLTDCVNFGGAYGSEKALVVKTETKDVKSGVKSDVNYEIKGDDGREVKIQPQSLLDCNRDEDDEDAEVDDKKDEKVDDKITIKTGKSRNGRRCPYCVAAPRAFTSEYLTLLFEFYGYPITNIKLFYNKNHSQNSYITFDCMKCKLKNEQLLSKCYNDCENNKPLEKSKEFHDKFLLQLKIERAALLAGKKGNVENPNKRVRTTKKKDPK
jgi:hypothetical protein